MRVLIVSDTHGRNDNFLKVLEKEMPVDMVIHCGDTEGGEYTIASAAGCGAYIVCGNNDFFSELPKELDLEIEGYRVWVTHGHNYYVSMGNETIKSVARQRGFDMVIYGHTHRPLVDEEDDLIALNPGSLSYPRQSDRRPSYIIMKIDEYGDATFEVKYA